MWNQFPSRPFWAKTQSAQKVRDGVSKGANVRYFLGKANGGIYAAAAQLFSDYIEYYFAKVPLTPSDRYFASSYFFYLGSTWDALFYNAYNRDYAKAYAKLGRKHLESLAEGARRISRQCWGYPALRDRLTKLVNNSEFAESTYLAFFLGILFVTAGV